MDKLLYICPVINHKHIYTMNNFSKTYYPDNFIISIKINRNELCCYGCRLTIKDTTKSRWLNRIVYTQFRNDKNMFKTYESEMKKVKVPKRIIDEVIDDIKGNLLFEKVIVYRPIKTKLPWNLK